MTRGIFAFVDLGSFQQAAVVSTNGTPFYDDILRLVVLWKLA